MPIYLYKCSLCQSTEDRLRPVSKRDDVAWCEKCGKLLDRVASVPASVIINGIGYTDVNTLISKNSYPVQSSANLKKEDE